MSLLKIFQSAESITNFLRNTKGFDRVYKNIKIIKLADGYCTAEFKVEEGHANAMKTLHGGFVTTLIDTISTLAFVSRKEFAGLVHVSVNIHVMFVKAPKVGDKLILDTKIVKTEEEMAYLECDIRDKVTNDLLIKGTHTKYVVLPKK